jgi:Skp family chaperone for outer membrane proteins
MKILKILAKKNLVTNEEINKELRSLQVEFQNYRKNKIKEIDKLKTKRNRNILNFIKLINPIIEKYMSDNSISILLDKKNIFIASKNYDITKNLITLIDKDIKSIDIE